MAISGRTKTWGSEGIVTLTGASHSLANSEPRSGRDAGTLPNLERCGLKGSDHVFATIGSLDHPEDWPPNEHFGIESQVPWLVIHDDLPRTRTDESPNFIAAKAALDQDGE